MAAQRGTCDRNLECLASTDNDSVAFRAGDRPVGVLAAGAHRLYVMCCTVANTRHGHVTRHAPQKRLRGQWHCHASRNLKVAKVQLIRRVSRNSEQTRLSAFLQCQCHARVHATVANAVLKVSRPWLAGWEPAGKHNTSAPLKIPMLACNTTSTSYGAPVTLQNALCFASAL